MITAVGADGRTREMFCLRSDKVAMWLATIDTSRIANDEARAKLVMWQCEAADALDRWVRGEQGVAEHTRPAALPPGWSMRKLADIMDTGCGRDSGMQVLHDRPRRVDRFQIGRAHV